MMWVGADGEGIIHNQPVAPADTTDGYPDAFEQYIRHK